MAAFDSEQYDIDILDNGRTVRDFIDKKIEQLSLEVSVTTLEPFHVADLDDVYKKHLTWSENLPRVKPFYAVKCNNTPAIIRTLSALGTGFDCASKIAATINVALDEFFPPECGVQIIAEPGRYFVESAFTLAVNVIGKRAMMEEAAEQNSNVSTLYVIVHAFSLVFAPAVGATSHICCHFEKNIQIVKHAKNVGLFVFPHLKNFSLNKPSAASAAFTKMTHNVRSDFVS
uniref:ornithine decarboxylase n=1 Tax=Myripristis murdjan TaxID=586833 RepID=A0A667WHN0_9TELE